MNEYNDGPTAAGEFTPALGKHAFTADYDRVIAVMTREHKWRTRLIDEMADDPGKVIVDIGSGTGTLAVCLSKRFPNARVVAIDPDPVVREIAERKAVAEDVSIEFVTAMGDVSVGEVGPGEADTVVITLVLHQCTMVVKCAILERAFEMLKPGRRLLVADYGEQRSLLMQMLFRQVRALDGFENTRANKDGMLPVLMADAGFANVEEAAVTQTPTGSISLYVGTKPR